MNKLFIITLAALTIPLLAPQGEQRTVSAFLAAMAREGNGCQLVSTDRRHAIFFY